MQGDGAGGEIEVFDPLETGVFHHPLEAFLVGMHADGFGEIAVGSCIVRDQPAQPGQAVRLAPWL